MFFVALYIYYMSGRLKLDKLMWFGMLFYIFTTCEEDVMWFGMLFYIFTTCQEDVMWFGMLFYRDCKRKFK